MAHGKNRRLLRSSQVFLVKSARSHCTMPSGIEDSCIVSHAHVEEFTLVFLYTSLHGRGVACFFTYLFVKHVRLCLVKCVTSSFRIKA